jgi:hypothetical protein
MPERIAQQITEAFPWNKAPRYPRPRRDLRCDRQASAACHGHSGKADRAWVAMTEWVHGETDRHDAVPIVNSIRLGSWGAPTEAT